MSMLLSQSWDMAWQANIRKRMSVGDCVRRAVTQRVFNRTYDTVTGLLMMRPRDLINLAVCARFREGTRWKRPGVRY